MIKQAVTWDGRQKALRIAAGALVFLNLAQLLAGLLTLNRDCRIDYEAEPLSFLSGFAFTVVGLLIIIYRPDNRVGWLMIVTGFGMSGFAREDYIVCEPPYFSYVAWFNHRLLTWFVYVPLFILLPSWFPTGRFLSPRWRRLCLGGLAVIFALVLVTALAPDMHLLNAAGLIYDLESPVSWTDLPDNFYQALFYIQAIITILLSLAGIISMAIRLKRSRGIERQQMKWFTFFLSIVIIQLLIFELPSFAFHIIGQEIPDTAAWNLFAFVYENMVVYVVFLGFPLVIGLTIFRYRLYEIDIIIRKTLIYSVVTVSLVAIYFVAIILLQWLFTVQTDEQSPLATVLSTLLIAALFSPVRSRVQGFIDRRFYRRKYDAAQLLDQFGQTVRDEVKIEALTGEMVNVVQQTMHPEARSIWLNETSSHRGESNVHGSSR